MRFLVDAQLPPALARLLREHGHEADHVTDIGPGDASDQDLWRFALANEAIIVTKDEDFSNMIAVAAKHPRWPGYGSETPVARPCSRGSNHSSTRSSA